MSDRYRSRHIVSSLFVLFALLTTPRSAAALFNNGLFEQSPPFTGWTVEYAKYQGNDVFTTWTTTLPTDHPAPYLRTAANGAIAPTSLDVAPYEGISTGAINDIEVITGDCIGLGTGCYHATQIYQTDLLTQADLDSGCLEIDWGALLQNPGSGHVTGDQPYFLIELRTGGASGPVVATYRATGIEASTPGSGWTDLGNNYWYVQSSFFVNLKSYTLGTPFYLLMRVTDCAQGGHGGMAFIDNIHTVTCPCINPDQTLVAHYTFDSPGMPGLDSSGNHLDGTLGSQTGLATGACKASVRFLPDNNVDEFTVPHDAKLNVTGAMTGMAWIRPWGPQSTDNNPSCTEGTIFTKGANYWLQVEKNNDQLVYQNDAGSPGAFATANVNFPLGVWRHVAFVRSAGDNLKLFVDGVQVGPSGGVNLTSPASANTDPLMVGNHGFGNAPGACEFNGDIDEIRLFSRVLTPAEINDIYLCTCPSDTCEARDSLMVNTGWEQTAGGVEGIGTPDNEWMVVSDPDPATNEPRPAIVIPKGNFSDPQPESQWINWHPSPFLGTFGHYIFEYRFCLDDPAGAEMNLSVLADDQGTVFLNGNQIGATPPIGSTSPTLITTSSFFVAGVNILQVDIDYEGNYPLVNLNIPPGMGLDLTGSVTGTLPLPAFCCSDSTCGLYGNVWSDTNHDGVRQNNEFPMPPRPVHLSSGQNTTTDVNGNYFFMKLVPGTYTVTETPPSLWYKSAPPPPGSYTVTLSPGDVAANLDFGNYDGTTCPDPVDVKDVALRIRRNPQPSDLFGRTVNASTIDTVRYGGTVWAADSARWEAVRDGRWTFDSGVGSSYTPALPDKPGGYHSTMEGWRGVDLTAGAALPYFRRSTNCALGGSFSLWAGVTASEASSLCYAAGRGYGNNWMLVVGKTFAYPGAGCVTLSYKRHVEAEPGQDFLCAAVDTTGTGDQPDVVIAAHTGVEDGTATFDLSPGLTLRSTPGNVTIKFIALTDGAYSDEDGAYPTDCGLAEVDDVSITGAIVDFSNFETGSNGWAQILSTVNGVGDYSDLASLTELPPIVSYCSCGLADSVLVFFDPLFEHPLDQDNIAISPWIDLKRGGDAGRPGKLILFDVYAELPLSNYVFLQMQTRWYPSVCGASGLVTRTPFRPSVAIGYFGEAPFCTPAGRTCVQDIGVDAYAEQIQIAIGVVNLCRSQPFGSECTGVTNTTPWLDNISLGVYGPQSCPVITVNHFDDFQDMFASDGTLNPASSGRLDISFIRHGELPGRSTSAGDTLVASGDGGNTEVRLVFHVRPGPFTSIAALNARSAEWTPEPSMGAGWYSARMDTAEIGGQAFRGLWMSTFHENDPGFSGTDRTADPQDPSELENEILPDHVLTPGSRVDYFVKARYIPPDPRNPGGTHWCVFPDTAGGRYSEIEILPSSMAADSSWNCTLYVDHHDGLDSPEQVLEEQGLTASLGVGGQNDEGTRYDRYDVRSPSSRVVSFGRPLESRYGCSVLQSFAYKNVIWHSGTLSTFQLTVEDANVLGPWLTLRGIGNNRFWGSGDGLATSMAASVEPSTLNFMRNILGAIRTCDTIRNSNCPTGSLDDLTFCLPTSAVAGAGFATTTPTSLQGNGCPDERSFDLISVNAAVVTARGQMNYVKNGTNRAFASVTNHNTLDVDYKTVLDGFAVGRARTTNIPTLCAATGASIGRTDNILDWFASPFLCKKPAGIVDVPEVDPPKPPQFRDVLGNAYPNPMNPTTRIQFTNGTENGRVTLAIFDLTGRLVKTLVDASLPAGFHEVLWDGTNNAGSASSSGMYFYKMTSDEGRYVASKKLIIMK